MLRPLLAVALPVALIACAADTGEQLSESPCAETWGSVPATGRVHVDPTLDSGGDGSEESPFADPSDALDAARTRGIGQIAIARGEVETSLLLSSAAGDDGLEIVGCGRESTVLRGVAADLGGPVVDITDADTQDILVRDLALSGGRRSLVIRGGAGAAGAIRIERVDVLRSRRVGIVIDGQSTVAELRDVLVDGVEAEVGQYGWGISVRTLRQISIPFEAPVVLDRVEVLNVQGLGVFAEGAWLQVEDTRVDGVAQSGGRLGRGLQIQAWSVATLDGVVSRGNSDSAIFLVNPGRPDLDDPEGPATAVELFDCLLGPTSPSAIPETDAEAADGIVATQQDPEAPYPPGSFRVVLDGTELAGNERAHAIADAVTFEVGPNNVFGKGTWYPIASQAGAVVQGIGGGEPGEEAVELDIEEALELDRLPLVPDAL